MNEKKIIDLINDERFRSNLESGLTVLVAIAIVIIGNGLVSGFTWDLFFSIEPYASGISTGIASSLVINNMITRGYFDELLENEELKETLDANKTKEDKLSDYDYIDHFLTKYNKEEYDRLQRTATDKQIKLITYKIAKKRSKGKKTVKMDKLLNYIKEQGATVKRYKPVTMLDLLSFETDNDLVGSDKINFNPIKQQQKGLARSKIIWFLASGIVAGIPITTGKNVLSIISYVSIFLLLIIINGFRAYTRSRRLTKTTYHKSMNMKGKVMDRAIIEFNDWKPKTNELQVIKLPNKAVTIDKE